MHQFVKRHYFNRSFFQEHSISEFRCNGLKCTNKYTCQTCLNPLLVSQSYKKTVILLNSKLRFSQNHGVTLCSRVWIFPKSWCYTVILLNSPSIQSYTNFTINPTPINMIVIEKLFWTQPISKAYSINGDIMRRAKHMKKLNRAKLKLKCQREESRREFEIRVALANPD